MDDFEKILQEGPEANAEGENEGAQEASSAFSDAAEEAVGSMDYDPENAGEEQITQPTDEGKEAFEETGPDGYDAGEIPKVQPEEPVLKTGYIPKTAVIAAAGCLCLAVIIAAVIFITTAVKKDYNPYNDMGYYNFSGKLLGEVASESNMTLEEFIAEYELPTDMRADTEEVAAYYMMPVRRLAQMYGIDFETFKLYFGFPDEVTEDMSYGEAYDMITLSVLFGEDITEFKEYYGFGDEVTGDTTWGEVRRVVDKKRYEDQLAAEAEMQNALNENEDGTE